MSALDVVVLVAGTAVIGWELWYFLGPRPPGPGAAPARAQEVRVTVRQGFEPDVIPVEAGRPVRLVFYRDETAECTGELIFETLDIRTALPALETAVVEFTPPAPGDYPFRCGHTDYRGRVVAQAGPAAPRAETDAGHRRHG